MAEPETPTPEADEPDAPTENRPDETVLAELAQAFADEPARDARPADDESADQDAPGVDEPSAPQRDADQHVADDGPDESSDGTFDGPSDESSDGSSDEPAGDVDERAAEGGIIGEPTVARRTIRIGGDDPAEELPDAVYLDEELATETDTSGVVFIDDADAVDAVTTTDAAPSMEPRLRQRRIGVRRAASRKRLKWVVIAAVVVLLLGGTLAVFASPLFAVNRIDVTGAVYTDSTELQAVIDELRGTPVLTADTGAAEERLEAIPWVENARVRTRFPNSATIEIRERVPLVAIRGTDGLFRVLDRDGRVLDSIEGEPVAMVIITGPGTLDLAPGGFAPIGYAAASSLVTKLTPNVRSRVDSIVVTADGSDLRVFITNGENPPIEVQFGSALGDNDQIEKLVRLERVLEDVGTDPVRVINVSTSDVTVL